jgi:16S rRNA (uracil1498-N3)-methyltransferase
MPFRFFLPKHNFTVSDQLFLLGDEYHHAHNVLRVAPDDLVYLQNGEGYCATARIGSINKKQLSLTVVDVHYEKQTAYPITLILAYLKPGHLDFALEKGTELGIDHFIFYQAEKSERKEMGPNIVKRCEHLIIAAMKQSSRLYLPSMTLGGTLKNVLNDLNAPFLFCDIEKNIPYIDVALKALHPSPINILIGSESGFSHSEKTFLHEHGTPVLLHKNILRAETAAICASFSAALWRNQQETANFHE